MKTHPFTKTRASRPAAHQPGLAIVVVVSLMALLMLLVLAFLLTSSTNRNISSTDVAIRQADSIADLAKETVIADLIGEMKDGSKNTAQNEDGTYSFDIENPKAIVPSHAVSSGINSDTNFNLIIKQSANGVKFSNLSGSGSSAVNRASTVSTSQKDLDGRKIAEARWSAPKFFPPGTNLSASQVPDWIYTTRDGSNPTSFSAKNSKSTDSSGTPSPDYIVGRYAYQIYDTSGLLDANVAGNVSATAPANVLSRKGSLVWADLSVLPKAGNIAGLADWRRVSSKNWPKGISNSGVEDFIREWGSVNGWMKTPLTNDNSDNLFVSRKDLIDFQKKNPNILSEDNLPYFTTHSQALNRPSWAPTLDAPNPSYKYKSDKDNISATNRRIAGVLVKRVFKRRDKSMAIPGEPLVKSRFPLSKLIAFESPQNLADIENYFGLTPINGLGGTTWKYTKFGTDASGNQGILPLEEVANSDREPNFFELLNAGLLKGSLANTMDENYPANLPPFIGDIGRDKKDTYQILRIGACIIDQWDSDSDPTVIQYGQPSDFSSAAYPDNAVGVENMPYFHLIGETRFRKRDTGNPPNDSNVTSFINFQLWNPHKNASAAPGGNYRIAYEGEAHFYCKTTSSDPADPGYKSYRQDAPVRACQYNADYISFNAGGTNSFETPVFMMPGKAGAVAAKPDKDQYSGGGASCIGFGLGTVSAPYLALGGTTTGSHNKRYEGGGFFSAFDKGYVNFALQKEVNGAWVTYQVVPRWSQTHGFVASALPATSATFYAAAGKALNTHVVFADPRTTRYGVSSASTNLPPQPVDLIETSPPKGYPTRFYPPSSWTTPGISRFPGQFISNTAGGPTVVVNRDGIRRPADAGSPFTSINDRPEILNRRFQSVADMGYAFRDDPWTTLNLYGDSEDSKNPGDGALLDLFCLSEKSTTSGVVNPNSASISVLQTLLSQASIREGSGAANLSTQQAKTYAEAINAELKINPLTSLGAIATLAGKVTTQKPIPGYRTQKDRQVIARALADVSNVRTWSFLVDIVAQSGKLGASASNLEQFVTQAETHCWYQISIDRITGKILDFQRSLVTE